MGHRKHSLQLSSSRLNDKRGELVLLQSQDIVLSVLRETDLLFFIVRYAFRKSRPDLPGQLFVQVDFEKSSK